MDSKGHNSTYSDSRGKYELWIESSHTCRGSPSAFTSWPLITVAPWVGHSLRKEACAEVARTPFSSPLQLAGVKSQLYSPEWRHEERLVSCLERGPVLSGFCLGERCTPGDWMGLNSRGRSSKTGMHSRGVSVSEAGSIAYCMIAFI